MLWQEHYRPNTLDEVIGQPHIVPRLKFMVNQLHESGDDAGWPHMMYAGPAGTGKTTVAIAMMRTLFGDDWKANWLEMNASDERSISVIRTKVKEFASQGVIGTYKTPSGVVRPIPFNIVFLDECDSLTLDAQSALRRIMEKYSKHTRFILSCNYPHKLIDPVRDRCAFADTRFRPIEPTTMTAALTKIANGEELDITPDAIEAISTASGGSMRKSLNILFSVTRVPGTATVEDVADISHSVDPKFRARLLQLAIKANNSDDNAEYRQAHIQIDRAIDELGQRGFNGQEILEQVYRTVSEDEKIPDDLARRILGSMGQALYYASTSQDDLLSVKTFFRMLT